MIWGAEPRRQWAVLKAWLRAQAYALPRLRRLTTLTVGRRLVWISVELEPGAEKIFLADYTTYPAHHVIWSLLNPGSETIRRRASERPQEA